jgi:ParB family transcriptional regulator, chromosome partitioning protein
MGKLDKLAQAVRRTPTPAVQPGDADKIARRTQAAQLGVAERTGTVPGAVQAPAMPATAVDRIVPSGAVGIVAKYPLAIIDDSPYQSREFYDPEELQDLAASIGTKGLEQPIRIAPHPSAPGRFISLYGHRRRRASAIAGLTEIDCIVVDRPMTPMEMFLTSYTENKKRSDQCHLDDAFAWQKLLREGHAKSQGDIAMAVGISEAVVAKTLAVHDLPASVLEVMKEKPKAFGMKICYEISLIHKALRGREAKSDEAKKRIAAEAEETTKTIALRIAAENLSVRDVEQIRQQIETPKKRKTKEVSRQYKMPTSEGVEGGVYKEWDDGRIQITIKISDVARNRAVASGIKDLLGIKGLPGGGNDD